MSTEKATAIVLRTVEFSETSYVVSLFTREFGKVEGLAKGARRPKGPFESALDLLSVCRVVFIRKSADVLDLLTEAKLQRRFRLRGRDLAGLYAGYYIVELLRDLTEVYDPHPGLFDVADHILQRLTTGEDVAAGVMRFELVALRELGHLPSTSNCVECGRQVEQTPRVAFGRTAGGVLCKQCRPGKRNVISITREALLAMEQLADPDVDRWQSALLPRPLRGELRGLMGNYISNLLGRQPRLLPYLGS